MIQFFFKRLVTVFIVVFGLFLLIGFTDFENLGLDEFLDIFKVEHQKNNKKPVSVHNLESDEVIISRVVDGDTVIVINNEGEEERVRLLLIDTPESVHPDKPVEKFGKEASDYAKKYLNQGTKVVLERGNPEKDKYDRTLGYIFVDGINFNQHMIEKGYARVAFVYEPNTKYLEDFERAEKRAKTKKINIWSIEGYVTDEGFDMSVVD